MGIGRQGFTKHVMTGTLDGSFSGTININRTTFIEAIYLHFSTCISTTSFLKLTVDSSEGEVYDTVILKEDMNNLTDYAEALADPYPLLAGDRLLLEYGNSTDSPVYGLTIVMREAKSHIGL